MTEPVQTSAPDPLAAIQPQPEDAKTTSNWLSLLILLAMLIASFFSRGHELAAAGSALLTFSALAITPNLLGNLRQSDPKAPDAVGLLSPAGALWAVAAVIRLANATRWLAWGVFALAVVLIVIGIAVTEETLHTLVSAILLLSGFGLGFAAYSALSLLRIGFTVVEGSDPMDVAKLISSTRLAAWLGSASFVLGSILVFADAMKG